jgi:hypothetical protein
VHFRRRGPGRTGFLTFYFSGPGNRGVFTQLADTDRQNDNGFGPAG